MATFYEVSYIMSLTTGKVAKMILEKIFKKNNNGYIFTVIYQTDHINKFQ